MIAQIVARNQHNGIGYKNDLPWVNHEDLSYFSRTTRGKIIIMGRKTLESIGGPLQGRYNYIVTRNPYHVVKQHSMVECFGAAAMAMGSIDKMLEEAKTTAERTGLKIFIIGGQEIYRAFLPYTDEILITEIQGYHKCDTFYPDSFLQGFHKSWEVEGNTCTFTRWKRS